ncbi:MAG: TonB-dependent receptor, partial [Bacteroidetes bacterium]|nr:TonB-dependent receptor [Bacteroidota bacterium]
MRNITKRHFSLSIFLIILCICNFAYGQSVTQTIRGKVSDQDSEAPLESAKIIVLGTNPILGAVSDENGNFRIDHVPVGRVSIRVSYLGYEYKNVPNLLLNSAKELILNISLIESIHTTEEVVIGAKQNKTEVINEMAMISSRSFSVEETKIYAGAIDDPARMVSAFAGVNGNAEGNNDIVVRGNSPRGILWRLEGVEIPNPNHFASEGATGGPINALNSNMLGNSDFFTGAFAPEYGNAFSGVFDMHLRNGNNEQREYSASLSVLGTDLTVEGPFKKGYAGSYLANYRYSTLALIDNLGILDFNGIPKYQDASYKINLPVGKTHFISLFGMGGLSNILQESTDPENEDRILWKADAGAKLGVGGLSHMWLINDQMYLKTTVSAAGTQTRSDYDARIDGGELVDFADEELNRLTLRIASTFNYKVNARHKLRTGLILSRQNFNLKADSYNILSQQVERDLAEDGYANMLQGFASWKYRVSQNLSMVGGFHFLHSFITDHSSIEPRLALKWDIADNQSITIGTGIHSRAESVALYLSRQLQSDGTFLQPNQNLDFMKAAHYVLGYNLMLNSHTRLKLEGYYQHLYNVPVEDQTDGTWSILNNSAGYINRNLINEGTGRNYGVELTFERLFHQGFYYMSTISLYKSLYTALDGVERESTYDGNYVANFLGGKEFRFGKVEKNRVFFVNSKIALIGGQRYTPIDLEASRNAGTTIEDEK